MQGTFLMVLGLVWPRLKLSRVQSTVGSSLGVYGCIAAWAANLLAAIWGAGNSMVPLAAGSARGSILQEMVIRILLISAAVSLISAAGLTVWGLRAMRTTDS
jgi:hydroxylaminobenzene mutase